MAVPVPPEPLHPIKEMDRGVSATTKPRRALRRRQFWSSTPRLGELVSHRCRVTKGLAELTLDIVLGREVELLELLGRDGDGLREWIAEVLASVRTVRAVRAVDVFFVHCD